MVDSQKGVPVISEFANSPDLCDPFSSETPSAGERAPPAFVQD